MTTSSYSEIEKRHILSILGNTKDLMTISFIKLYTCNLTSNEWLYSGLEGYLCYYIDFKLNSAFLSLYEIGTYQKLFQLEQYLEFNKYFTKLNEKFHCFELNQSYIGFEFENAEDANILYNIIMKFDDTYLLNLFNNSNNRVDKFSKGETNLKVLKDKLQKEKLFFPTGKDNGKRVFENFEVLYDKYYSTGLDIFKPTSYSIILNFEFDNGEQI